MSKIPELSAVLDALIECGKELTKTAETLRDVFSTDSTEGEGNAPPKDMVETTAQRTITLEEVRATLAEKSRVGKTAAVKELLQKHGADRLSDIDPNEYPTLFAEAEVL